jgi:O-antigen ligase
MLRNRSRAPAQNGWHMLAPWFVGAALLLGGASAAGSSASLFLYLVTVPVIAYAVVRRPDVLPVLADRWLLGLAAAFLALAIAHLIPLPPSVWASLPGREMVERGHSLAALEGAWHPMSVHPQATILSLLAVLPAAAVALLFLRARRESRQAVSIILLMVALASLAVGFLQATGGRDSPLYFHEITNVGMAVGFFANANHLTTLFLISIPVFATLLRVLAPPSLSQIALIGGVIFYAMIAAVGMYLSTSHAGGLLIAPTLAASLFVIQKGSGRLVAATAILMFAGGALLAAAVWLDVLTFNTGLGLDELSRLGIAQRSQAAGASVWPIGSGLGTFPTFYPLFEDAALVEETYVNHAHNDYLEFVLENGIAGVLIIVGFVAWWLLRSVQAWRHGDPWQRAASIVLGVVLAHSAVDYPLRTPAILVVFTFYALVLASVSTSARATRSARS